MNKVKFLFAAVAIVAVGAAISASKAQIGDTIYTTDKPNHPCVNQVHATLLNQGQGFILNTYATTISGADCALTDIFQPL